MRFIDSSDKFDYFKNLKAYFEKKIEGEKDEHGKPIEITKIYISYKVPDIKANAEDSLNSL